MKNMKKKNVPIYRGQLMLIVDNDPEKIRKHIPSFNRTKESLYAHTWMFGHGKDGRQTFCIILNFNASRPIYPGVIAHEVEHVKNMIFAERGAETNPNDDETQAYLVEWITDEIYAWLKEMKMINKIDYDL